MINGEIYGVGFELLEGLTCSFGKTRRGTGWMRNLRRVTWNIGEGGSWAVAMGREAQTP